MSSGGLVVTSSAMMLMFYGLCTFLRRQRNIRAHKPTGYDDPHGPVRIKPHLIINRLLLPDHHNYYYSIIIMIIIIINR